MKKVLCLEADWYRWHGTHTVKPIMELAKAASQRGKKLDILHKSCNTLADLEDHIQHSGRQKSYSMIYLAMHGAENELHVRKEGLSLDELAEKVGNRWEGRYVHFGSCSTVSSGWVTKRFMKQTGVEAVSGYCNEVDWDMSTVFDYLCLRKWTEASSIPHFAEEIRQLAKGPFRGLGFKITYA